MRKRTVLPKPIRIGAHTWTFKRMLKKPKEGAVYAVDYEDMGVCDFNSHTIFISPLVKGSHLAETVLHEITHAINDDHGVVDGVTEELFTDMSSKGWTKVIQDNLHIWEYIRDLLHGHKEIPYAGAGHVLG